MLSILISIGIAYAIYWCFENYGFKLAFAVSAVIQFISTGIQYSWNNIIYILIISLISSLIGTSIDYLIYKKTNSFVTYLLLSIVIGVIITMGLAFLITILAVKMM